MVITAIAIPADLNRPVERVEIKPIDVDAYRALVGGNLEVLGLDQPPASLYVNEEGKLDGLPLNHRATSVLWMHSSVFRGKDVVAGDAFIVGPADEHGNDLTVPAELETLLLDTPSYRVEVKTYGSDGWYTNQLVFDRWPVAYGYALDLAERWTLVEKVRVVPAV
jgi:hypothetical protein